MLQKLGVSTGIITAARRRRMDPLRAAISDRLECRLDEEFADELLERAIGAYSARRASGE